ncbi:MAG: glycosyltransferase family 4 protein [Candidatus Hydrogenedentes bacterium]|nr:glycosyltransferase family 4 protein [Candidatus Hydrogenedentota bacterium]
MRVAVNALGIKPGWGGGEEVYLRGVMTQLGEIERATDFVVLADADNYESFDSFERVTVGPLGLSRAISKSGASALLSPLRTAPKKSPVPVILLVMELFSLKEEAPQKRFRAQSSLKEAREILKNAVAVVVPSEFIKRELLERFEVPLNMTVVAPLGVSEEFAKPQSCIVEQPYFLVVGRISGRKNIPLLLEAFERIASEIPHCLVVVGQPSESEPEDWGPRVVRIDRVGTTQLAGLYQHSDLVICPSLYEGSGVLVLEALKAGARVAVGRVGGITEVAGDAPIFFNPESVDSLVGALRRAVSESVADRQRRLRSGKQATHEFTWENTALQTLMAFRRAIGPE